MTSEKWVQINNSKYEISNFGRARKFCKYKYRYLTAFRKGSSQMIKMSIDGKGKEYNVAKIVVENFIRKINENEVVFHKNGIKSDNRLENLEILNNVEAGKRTGWQSKRKSIVMLDDDGVIKHIYKGTRDASKKLFISRQTVSDYCNKKVKKPMYQLFWAENLIEE